MYGSYARAGKVKAQTDYLNKRNRIHAFKKKPKTGRCLKKIYLIAQQW